MSWLGDIMSFDTSQRAVRGFALTIAIALVVTAIGLALYSNSASYLWLGGTGIVLFLTSRICPLVLRPIHFVWMVFGRTLGWISTRVVLIAVFYLVMTPIALVARALGKRFLDIPPDPGSKSYWVKRSDSERTTDMKRQF